MVIIIIIIIAPASYLFGKRSTASRTHFLFNIYTQQLQT
jgi:hypothetical protein